MSHLNSLIDSTISLPQSGGALMDGPSPATTGEILKRRGPGRPSRVGVFRRLDVEIDEADCAKIDQMKATLGARSTVDVIRHALRVLFFLAAHVAQGYEITLTHNDMRKQFNIKMI